MKDRIFSRDIEALAADFKTFVQDTNYELAL